MYLKAITICKDLVYIMFWISTIGNDNWSFLSYLKKCYVRLDVKRSAAHCKGSPIITFGANIKNSSIIGS